VAPKGFLTAASEGVLRALFLAPFPAAPEAALAGALPPAFPGALSAALAAARTGALEAPSGAAPCTAIEAALEVRYPVRYAARTETGLVVRFVSRPVGETGVVLPDMAECGYDWQVGDMTHCQFSEMGPCPKLWLAVILVYPFCRMCCASSMNPRADDNNRLLCPRNYPGPPLTRFGL